MFDTEIPLEEFPVMIAGRQVATICGTAHLVEDRGYGFICDGIEITGDSCFKEPREPVFIDARTDNPLGKALFPLLAAQIEKDDWIMEQASLTYRDYWEAA